jgi:glycosyltransferase involved in cell wall biosynthesis
VEYPDVQSLAKTLDMKVCQLCAVDFTVEKFLLPLIDGMESAGWQVTTICSEGPAIPVLSKRGYRFRTVPIARSMNPFKAIRSIFALYKVFREEKFDIIHVHTPVAALLGRIAAALDGKSFVIYTAHGFYFHDEMSAPKRKLFVFLEQFAGKFTDLLFCQSSEDAQDAVKEGIMPVEKVLAIGNGVDDSKFNPVKYIDSIIENRKSLGIPEDAQVAGIIARMVKEKGYHELLEASINLAKRNPNFYLLIVGGKLASDHDQAIDEILDNARVKMGSRLVELGFRSDTPMLLSVMDVFCLPSYREGLPRTIIEAMMMGKPVIATDIRGCREEVIHGITGLLVPSKDSLNLEMALEQILADKELAKKMGDEGQRRSNNLYIENKIVDLQVRRLRKLVIKGI